MRKSTGMPRHIIPQNDMLTLKAPPSRHSQTDLDWIHSENLNNDISRDSDDKQIESKASKSSKPTEQKKRHVLLPSANSLEILEVILQ